MTKSTPFETALEEARKSLKEALEERRAIESRIVNLKKTIQGLTALCEPEPREDFMSFNIERFPGLQALLDRVAPGAQCLSLTDAIRRVFYQSKEAILTPPEVRDALIGMGFVLCKYKQPLVPIHNTLKRLEAQEEIVAFTDDHGKMRGYRWVSRLARAVAELHPNPALAGLGGEVYIPSGLSEAIFKQVSEQLAENTRVPKK